MSKLTSTRESVTFACWPPGPPDRLVRTTSSAAGISTSSFTYKASLIARGAGKNAGRSVLLWRAAKYDPLELGEAAAPEAQDGLEALAAELACVERPAELIETGTLLLEDLITGGLDQDQVAWAPFAVRQPNEAFTLGGVEALDRQHHALPRFESLQDGHIEQLASARLDLLCRDTAREQRVDLRKREHRARFLDHSFGEPVGLRRRSADDQQQASRRVAKAVRGTEDA